MAGSDEEAQEGNAKHSEESKKAIVRNSERKGNPKVAVFDIRGARQKAGDWITTVRKDLEKRFSKVEVLQTQDEGEDQNKSQNKNQNKSQDKKSQDETAKKKNMFDKMGKGLEQIHPLHVMNENLKDKLKEQAMGNRRKIAALLIEASIYCCMFDGAKKGLKRLTRNRKYTGATVRFVSDVALPNGLYGPIFGFLIRLTLPF